MKPRLSYSPMNKEMKQEQEKDEISLVVIGAPNTGKTTIITHLLHSLRTQGISVSFEGNLDYEDENDLVRRVLPDYEDRRKLIKDRVHVSIKEENANRRHIPNVPEEDRTK